LLFIQGSQKVAIVGLGGMGKTQVALELAHWTKHNKPDHSVFWVPVLSAATFGEAYVEIARVLQIQRRDKGEDLKELVRLHLSSDAAGPWLLILDNVDDMEMVRNLSQYLPEGDGGLILVTTRSRDVALSAADGVIVDLHEMSLQEAKSVLQNRLKDLGDNAAAEELLSELNYLPLAIAQAAAYLKRNQISIAKYLELLRGTEKDMVRLLSREFHDDARYDGPPNAVATTWLVSFDQIYRSDLDAADLLSFISQIEPKAIPQSILPGLGSHEQVVNAIGTLCGYAFLGRRGDGDMFDMHSLVHVATRIWIEKHGRAMQTETDAVRHLWTIFPPAYRGPAANREKWRTYLPHALRVLQGSKNSRIKARYDLFHWVGLALAEDRRFKEAIRSYTEASQWMKEHLAEEDRYRLASEHALASAYVNDRRFKEAVEIFEHVVTVQKKTRTEEDDFRLVSEHELARAYLDDGRIKEAIEILTHVVAIRKKTLIEEDDFRLVSEHELARAYLNNGRIKEAIEISEHVVAIRKKTLTEENRSRLSSEHELARAYLENGRIKEAIEILTHVVAIKKKTRIEEDHSRLSSEHELATAYYIDGRVKEAIKIFKHVVAVQEKTLAEEDHFRLMSERSLATVLQMADMNGVG
jgi:tetratricopeptide (TPR) repeat protein